MPAKGRRSVPEAHPHGHPRPCPIGLVVAVLDVPHADDDSSPGPCWGLLRTGDPSRPSAWLRCFYGHEGVLTDHTIAEDGTVSPSVECMEPGCPWHETVRLAGWREGAIK